MRKTMMRFLAFIITIIIIVNTSGAGIGSAVFAVENTNTEKPNGVGNPDGVENTDTENPDDEENPDTENPDDGENPDTENPNDEENPDTENPDGGENPDTENPDGGENPDTENPDDEENPDTENPDGGENPDTENPDDEENPDTENPDGGENPDTENPDGGENPDNENPDGGENPNIENPDGEIIPEEIIPEDKLLEELLMPIVTDSNLPEDIGLYESGKTYTIMYPRDFLILQTLSEQSSFADITFAISRPTDDTIWKLDEISGFDGIGSSDFPFQGEMYSYFSADAPIQTDCPIFSYLGDGAHIHDMAIGCNGGRATIADTIAADASITYKNITVEGSLSSNSYAGVIAGQTDGDVKISLDNVEVKDINISAKDAGGIIGIAKEGDIDITAANSSITGKVIGSNSAGRLFGQLEGTYSYESSQGLLLSDLSVEGKQANAKAGTYIGSITENGVFTLLDSSVSADVSGSGICGGVVGISEGVCQLTDDFSVSGNVKGTTVGGLGGKYTKNDTVRFKNYSGDVTLNGTNTGGLYGSVSGDSLEIIYDNAEINGNITASAAAGGLVGVVEKNKKLEIGGKSKISADTLKGNAVGGAVGLVDTGARLLLFNTTVEAAINGSGTSNSGGIVGNVARAAAVELAEEVNVNTNAINGSVKGLIAGRQTEALIYLSTDAVLTLPTLEMDEVGTYGGVYRNPDHLIGDKTIDKVGEINKTVSQSGDAYTLADASDFICLAVALHSQGNFGTEAFGNATVSDLLCAAYNLGADTDISYDKTGIVTLNRNDNTGDAYAFSGSVKGSRRITKNIINRQSRIGLFSIVKDAVFEGFTIDGQMERAVGAGSIAYEARGTTLSLNHMTFAQTITNVNSANMEFGGAFGRVVGTEGNILALTADNITVSAQMNDTKGGIVASFVPYMAYARLQITGFFVKDAKMLSNTQEKAGGFAGWHWKNVSGIIENTSVTNAQYEARQIMFGCLVKILHTTPGERLTLNNVKYSGVEVSGNNNKQGGLLIGDASEAVLEVIDYKVENTTLTNVASPFDEVAGRTINGTTNIGIVSIHSSTSNYPAYHYTNQTSAGQNNTSTRYYYDLFQHFDNADGSPQVTITGNVLDSAEKLLLYNVMNTAKGNARTYFSRYLADGVLPGFHASYELSGTLDMSDYSIYSTANDVSGAYTGVSDAKIIFAATDFATTDGQHNGLQSGLFYEPGNITVSNLTLAGTVMNLDTKSGALVSGRLRSGGTFRNIICSDLWISGYTGQNAAYGLLISAILSGTATFDGITMTDYPLHTTTKAAAALIGSAGSANERNLILKFERMVIADDIDTRSAHNGNALAYASLLYSYQYTDNANENRGSGLYLFTEAEALTDGIVTYGAELDADTEYRDTTNKVLTTPSTPLDHAHFKPYVFTNKKIEVNPKTGDILSGCGTYEDPYLIFSAKQFLTLYRYMNETGRPGDYQYQTFYEGWRVIQTGTDAAFCSVKHSVTQEADGTHTGDGVADMRTFGQAGFPTPDEMSRAYYKLSGNISLQGLSGTYQQIAEDFVGFGTAERPFTGVWVGGTDGTDDYIITMPDKSGKTYTTYALFQYVSGAVVKDLTIDYAMQAGSAPAGISTAGGTVAAIAVGGDNIFDNVSILNTGSTRTTVLWANTATTSIGGYIGCVKKGTVILRNISKNDIESFGVANGAGGAAVTAESHKYVGQLIGKVEDGYVVYEGEADDTKPLWEHTASHITGTKHPISQSFKVVNGAYMDEETKTASVTKTELTTSAGKYNLTVSLPTTASLYAVSAAVNTDSLNIRQTRADDTRSRKQSYDSIGTTNSSDTDYLRVKKYDNRYADGTNTYAYANAYVLRYFGLKDDKYLEVMSNEGSADENTYFTPNMLNRIAFWQFRTTYELTAADSYVYDLSIFGESFRGIGALYSISNDDSTSDASFRANFDGKGHTVKIAMIRSAVSAEDKMAGLFNCLYSPYSFSTQKSGNSFAYDTQGYYQITGENGTRLQHFGPYVLKDMTVTGSISAMQKHDKSLGAVAAEVSKGYYSFENIAVESFEVNSKGSRAIGAMLGRGGSGNSANTPIMIRDCRIGALNKTVSLNSGTDGWTYVGGFVGHMKNGDMTIRTSQASHINIISGYSQTGGFIGFTDANPWITVIGEETNPCTVTDLSITTKGYAGGIAGQLKNANTAIAYVQCGSDATDNNIKLMPEKSAGGIVGYLTTFGSANITIKEALVQNTSIEEKARTEENGLGGIVGCIPSNNNMTLTITDANVKNCTIKSSTESYSSTAAVNGSGGMIGNVKTGKIIIDKSNVSDTTVESLYFVGGFIGIHGTSAISAVIKNTSGNDNFITNVNLRGRITGGVVGRKLSALTVEDTKVTDSKILAKALTANLSGNAGGFIGSEEKGRTDLLKTTALDNQIMATGYEENTNHLAIAGGAIGLLDRSDEVSNLIEVTLTNNEIGIAEHTTTLETAIPAIRLMNKDAELTDLPADTDDLNADHLSAYAVQTGNVVGLCRQKRESLYALKTDISYTSAYTNTNRPVVDVGMATNGKLYDYRPYCHIMYEETYAASNTATINTTTIEKLDEVVAAYMTDKNSSAILDGYRLREDLTGAANLTNVANIEEYIDKIWQDTYTLPGDGTVAAIGTQVLVFTPEYGEVQGVLDEAIAMMTNVSGVPSSKNGMLTVTSQAMVWKNGAAEAAPPDTLPSVKAVKSGSAWQFSINTNAAGDKVYDGVNADGNPTYTLLTYTYTINKGGTPYTAVYEIPVFIEEMLEINIATKMIEGSVFSVDKILTDGVFGENIMMANDSDYTVLAEYTYNEAYKKYRNVKIPKRFYLERTEIGGTSGPKKIEKGTRLALVDVTQKNKVYYYTVTANNVTSIAYSDFADQNGTPYAEFPIDRLPEMEQTTGVKTAKEQFLIMVLKPENTDNREIYNIYVNTDIQDADLAAKTKITEETQLRITSLPGLSIGFIKDGTPQTDISGEISKAGLLMQTGVFSLSASDVYWGLKGQKVLDSANNGKYLEIALYLRDAGGNRVSLPQGTNVSFSLDSGATYSEWSAVANTSVFYYYKEHAKEYRIQDITEDTIVEVMAKFDFSLADLSDMPSGTYTAYMELHRSANKNYPIGENTKLDEYSKGILVKTEGELGFAVIPEQDKQLGINTYTTDEETQSIAFFNKLDFTQILENVSTVQKDSVAQVWADLEYHVDYKIYQKEAALDGTYTYKEYIGNDIKVVEETRDAEGNVTSATPITDKQYAITKAEILDNDSTEIKRPLAVYVETNGSVDLANYKIIAKLTVTDGSVLDGTTEVETEQDFFVFTVTKLKTDL